MAIRLRVHSVGGGKVPNIQALAFDSASPPAIVLGSICIWSSGLVTVASTDPTTGIVGVALQAASTNPGEDAANSPAPITGISYKVSVVRPNDNTIFMANLVNGSATTIAPVAADVGGDYGLRLDSGIWTVDKSLNDAVIVVGYDTNMYSPGVVFFKFQPSALADA